MTLSALLWHGVLLIAAAFVVCALLLFLIRRFFPVSAELSRKLVHFITIAILTVWLYAFPDWIIAEVTMAVFVVVVYIILSLTKDLPFYSFFSSIASERQKGELLKSLCATGFMFMLLVAVCWGHGGQRSLVLASIYAWGPGDAAAALIGKRYGKTKIGKDKKKSVEGTSAMFAASFLCVLIILLASGSFSFWAALLTSVLTAAVTAYVELTVLNGLDTFFCPWSAMTVLYIAHLVFG